MPRSKLPRSKLRRSELRHSEQKLGARMTTSAFAGSVHAGGRDELRGRTRPCRRYPAVSGGILEPV